MGNIDLSSRPSFYSREYLMKFIALMIAGCAAVLPCASTWATELLFDPSIMSIPHYEKNAQMKITNHEIHPITWRIKVFRWTHDQRGVQRLTPTRAIIVSHAEVRLLPKQYKIITIRRRYVASIRQENSYRIILSSAPIKKNNATVSFNYNLPIFINPKEKSMNMRQVFFSPRAGIVKARLENKGTLHSFVENIVVQGVDATDKEIFVISQPGWYVLPGNRTEYAFQVSARDCSSSAKIFIRTALKSGKVLEHQTSNMSCDSNIDNTLYIDPNSKVKPYQ